MWTIGSPGTVFFHMTPHTHQDLTDVANYDYPSNWIDSNLLNYGYIFCGSVSVGVPDMTINCQSNVLACSRTPSNISVVVHVGALACLLFQVGCCEFVLVVISEGHVQECLCYWHARPPFSITGRSKYILR
eukprot:1429613-Amphidinium_carterae.1